MAIKLSWYKDDHAALLYTFPTHWTWQDFYDVKQEADLLLDALDDDLPLILDLRRSNGLPTGAINQGNRLVTARHPRGKPIILVGMNPIIRAMLSLVNQVNPLAETLLLAVSTMDEADEYLRRCARR